GAGDTSFSMDEQFAGMLVDPDSADVVIASGDATYRNPDKIAILIEVGNRFLADAIGLQATGDNANVLGFSHYRNGADEPSKLVEVVRASWTTDDAVAAARAALEEAGFISVVCTDQPGRIIDRLVRPKYNAALRFLDEGLATQTDID